MRTITLILIALFALPCEAQQPTVALITRDVCPPCKPAKKLVEKLNSDGFLGGCDLLPLNMDHPEDAELVKSFGIKVQTPMLVLLEKGKVVKSVSTVDQAHVAALLAAVPLNPREPMEFDASSLSNADETPTFTAAAAPPRIIRYTIATMYKGGTTYQGTFLWGDVDRCLNFMGRYWNIQFVRANSGTLKIVQANYQHSTPGAFAWTNTNTDTIYISPVANYQRSLALTLKVLVHEFGHAALNGNHNPDPRGIMSTNTGTAGNFIESDAKWFQSYAWKGALRPWHEPNYMREFAAGKVKATLASKEKEFWELPRDYLPGVRTRKVDLDSLHVTP